MSYTTIDYRSAIERELGKRQTTYPKIIERKQKHLGPDGAEEIAQIAYQQGVQFGLLEGAKGIIIGYDIRTDRAQAWRELRRELKMRQSLYPRWVRWGRMDADTAQREIAVWDALCNYFHTTYCPEAPLRAPRRKPAYTHAS